MGTVLLVKTCQVVKKRMHTLFLDMAKAKIILHLKQAEMLRAVGMLKQGATYRKIGVTFRVDNTIITSAWAKYQQQGTRVKSNDCS